MKSSRFSILSLCALVPLPVFGIGADETSRPSPPSQERTERPVREDTLASGGQKATTDQVLLPSLRGITLAPTSELALTLQSSGKNGLTIEGFSEQESQALRKAVEKQIGQPVSLKSLDALSTRLEVAFRALGRPFMKVTFPPQEITSGIVAIRISQAVAGKVLLSGKPSFGLKFAADAFRTRSGQPIVGDTVLEDLDWINENSLRRASISYRDGATSELLDLTLKLQAAKPWRAYAGIDNQLSDHLGDERLFLGFQHGDLFALDHRLTAQYSAALDLQKLQGISGIYELPLAWRHLAELAVGYTRSESDTAGPIDQSGNFSRIALAYRIPLPRWHLIAQESRFGMEFRDNEYSFSSGPSQAVKFFQIDAGWKGRLSDRHGLTTLDTSIHYSPGHGILGSEDQDFTALGADGAESWIAEIRLERSLNLGEIGSLISRTQAQWASSILLPSDQISAGGMNRVRGFDEAVGYASTGLVSSIEYQTRSLKTAHAGTFQGISFVDAAFLDQDRNADIGQLVSVGGGVHWRSGEQLSATAELGVPVNYPSSLDGNPMLQFSVTMSW